MTADRLSKQDLQEILEANFAPWIGDLGLEVIGGNGHGAALLRLPYNPRLAREGAAMCGQASAAAIDTAAALAICAAAGEYPDKIATAQLAAAYVRPLVTDAVIAAQVAHLGRHTSVQVTVADASQAPCAHALAHYAVRSTT